jgi:GntR family phosphonate transport system transcriptional regulator
MQSPINYAISGATRFTETLESQGRRTVSRILQRGEIRATTGVARRLRVAEESPVLHIETMREVDNAAFCTSSHFFPLPEYSAILIDYDGGSLHDFIYRRYGKRLRRILSLISAIMPAKEDVRRLKLGRNIPVLQAKSVNVDQTDGWPVEYVVTRFRGDAVQLSVEP